MKVPFALGLKFVFRIILPGFVLAIGFLPVLRTVVHRTDGLIPLEYVFAIAVLLLGWLIVIFDMPIYMAFEGRRYWPQFLRKLFVSSEKRRLQKLQRIIETSEVSNRQRYVEASVEIRWFPLNDVGGWDAKFPTRLGNLLTAYEEYSKRVYGMWQGFYWPRIWLTLDKDLRDEIDNRQALADSTLYTVFALYVSGLMCLIYLLLAISHLKLVEYLPRSPYLWLFPLGSFMLGYLIYRQSMHVHAQFGETFRAVFDTHGNRVMFPQIVEAISRLTRDSSLIYAPIEEQNLAVWFYLHNARIKCRLCGRVLLPIEIPNHECQKGS